MKEDIKYISLGIDQEDRLYRFQLKEVAGDEGIVLAIYKNHARYALRLGVGDRTKKMFPAVVINNGQVFP